MPFVARRDHLLHGHPGLPPAAAQGAEPFHRLAPGLRLRSWCRNEMGDRPAVTSDREALSPLDGAEELGKMRLGLGCLDLLHVRIHPVRLTGPKIAGRAGLSSGPVTGC